MLEGTFGGHQVQPSAHSRAKSEVGSNSGTRSSGSEPLPNQFCISPRTEFPPVPAFD